MESNIKKFVNNKKLATNRVFNWIGTLTKTEIAKRLDISRPTLDVRLKKSNWKLKELELINKNFPF